MGGRVFPRRPTKWPPLPGPVLVRCERRCMSSSRRCADRPEAGSIDTPGRLAARAREPLLGEGLVAPGPSPSAQGRRRSRPARAPDAAHRDGHEGQEPAPGPMPHATVSHPSCTSERPRARGAAHPCPDRRKWRSLRAVATDTGSRPSKIRSGGGADAAAYTDSTAAQTFG